MDTETLFTGSKWDILTSLSSKKRSPLELAQESKTSIANISQQLRLLEMAGLVSSERVPNRDRGQPRILYRIPEAKAFIVSTSPGTVRKGFVALSPARQALIGCWLTAPNESIELIDRFLLSNAAHIEKTKAILVSKKDPFSLLIITEDAQLRRSITQKLGKLSVEGRALDARIASHDFTAIYDPSGMIKTGG
jgi:DNA-binding MarR family transcriptional regulator